MKRYLSNPVVVLSTPMSRVDYNNYRGWTVPRNENPSDKGYLIEHVDGGDSNHPAHKNYISWSPKDVFEREYTEDTPHTLFGRLWIALREVLKKTN